LTPVVVDTSVWRRYFSGASNAGRLGELLDEDATVLTHPWVIAELVLGGLSTREERLLERLPALGVVPHGEVLQLVRGRKLGRRGLGWADVNLLASALVGSATLWTLDADLKAAAQEFGAAFTP
jgi:predicted nucleic acid-binding protein